MKEKNTEKAREDYIERKHNNLSEGVWMGMVQTRLVKEWEEIFCV